VGEGLAQTLLGLTMSRLVLDALAVGEGRLGKLAFLAPVAAAGVAGLVAWRWSTRSSPLPSGKVRIWGLSSVLVFGQKAKVVHRSFHRVEPMRERAATAWERVVWM